ncbi:plantaricin C family lantibiotic [Enterococcus durans]|nr:plantaricin C family lantibiotic [Enterococcus durans]TKN14983.1 plantaricin C family lantibiotic [Enterococcus sp. VV15]KAA9189074.1 plantaricin C family lantibiotic [Enterococcus durans]KAA9193203.1 plantaricin C family lantibiotic [Enterococcus durans]KAA9195044.1 plantaricin C family lantibiotic [Enterococcus durans]
MSPMMEEEIMDIETGIQAGCTTNTFSLSDYLGNTGGWCTATKECMPSCN